MYPPEVAGFTSSPGGKLQTVPVNICAMYAEGPRPIAYSPPVYDQIVRVYDDSGQRPPNMDGKLLMLRTLQALTVF